MKKTSTKWTSVDVFEFAWSSTPEEERMNIELARHTIRTGLRCGRELESLLAAVKAGCGEAEYKEHALTIAGAIHEIHNATLEKAFASFPELEGEVEADIAKYGRYL